MGLAASTIYLCCVRNGENKTQKDIAQESEYHTLPSETDSGSQIIILDKMIKWSMPTDILWLFPISCSFE